MALLFGKPNGSLAGKAIFSVLSGVIGTLVLTAFLVGIMGVYQVLKYLPLIIAFNTAMTGFSLIEKNRGLIVRKFPAAVGAGIANVVISLIILTLLSNYVAGENLISVSIIFLLLAIATVCSAIGAWLAEKAPKAK